MLNGPKIYSHIARGQDCIKDEKALLQKKNNGCEMNAKAPGIMWEVQSLTKQSCKNITTSKPYLKRK